MSMTTNSATAPNPERLRELLAADIDVMRDVYMSREQRAAYERLLHQLAERDAEVESLRNGAEREQLNLLTQLREAERARDEATGLVRELFKRVRRLPFSLASQVDAFLAASGGK